MKTLMALVATALLSFAVAFFVAGQRKDRQHAAESAALLAGWNAEKEQLESELAAAKRRKPPRIEVPPVPPTRSIEERSGSPDEIIEVLKHARIGTGLERIPSARRLIYQFEALADFGDPAIAAIREYLARFEDVDYPFELDATADVAGAGVIPAAILPPGSKSQPGAAEARLDFIVPPSLRLGLIDVLARIGSPAARETLGEIIATTGRAVEVAFAARALERLAPGAYREAALAAAKDLLADPVQFERPTRLDMDARAYLYAVFGMFGDGSFTAHTPIVDAEGRIDRNALTQLTSTLKEEAVPALYQAYHDAKVTNIWDKATLVNNALAFAGSNPQADKLLDEVVRNEEIPAWMRANAIQALAGSSFFGGNAPAEPEQVRARIELLGRLPELKDERIARAREEALQRLQEQLDRADGASVANSGAAGVQTLLGSETAAENERP